MIDGRPVPDARLFSRARPTTGPAVTGSGRVGVDRRGSGGGSLAVLDAEGAGPGLGRGDWRLGGGGLGRGGQVAAQHVTRAIEVAELLEGLAELAQRFAQLVELGSEVALQAALGVVDEASDSGAGASSATPAGPDPCLDWTHRGT